MKIAVISDIHGNLDALNAVLDDIKKEECEKIFALGDYVMAGPEPIETLNWFMEHEHDANIKMIQGNTDLMLSDYNNELYTKLKTMAPVMAEALKYNVELLNKEQLMFLRYLSPQQKIEIDGVKILLVHGSPRKNNEDILPDFPIKKVEDIIYGVKENIILCGHTHIPCGFQTSTKKTVINVGSIGRPFTPEPKSCYLKMTISNGECLFEHRFVEYNNQLASEKLSKQNFIGASKLSKTLLNPTERHF